LKKLYQQLFPKSVRHDLGEYYTPDWLAEHVLDKLGYAGDPDKRLLDPACGSGTFLVMIINRIKHWFDEHRHGCGYDETELLQKILKNVIGFDLNPLAVMAARTNFLIAIRDLLPYAKEVEIPIYLCDSIMTPAEYGGLLAAGSLSDVKRLKTAAGEFLIPSEVVNSREGVSKYAGQLEHCVRNEYAPDEFIARCKEEGIQLAETKLHCELYSRLRKLDKENQNGIWARIIKNAFAPLFIERVDYIAGNPPWINWESLPGDYREDVAPLWQRYGLFSLSGSAGRLGGGKKDLSMLFVYVCVDQYLREGGHLGFVITQSVFKTQGAGDGFRRFNFSISVRGGKEPKNQEKAMFLKPVCVDDMSSLQPFEGATNRTAVFVCNKDLEGFQYPIPYTVWRKTHKGRISQDYTLPEVLEITKQDTLAATPVDKHKITSPWLTAPEKALPGIQKVIGQSDYKAYEGVNSGGLNGCYWIRILEYLSNGDLLIENLYDVGKIKVDRVQMAIEPDLVYPLLRGRDVQRWQATPSAYIILAQDPQTRAGIPEETMKQKYPKTYAYFKKFEEQLRNRAGFKRYFKPTDPFWSMYNVGPYTMLPWKVIWNRIDTRLQGVVLEEQEKHKIVLCQETHTFVGFLNAEEAYFFCALFNSAPSDLLVRSYSVSKGFASPHVLGNIQIPKFNAKETVHKALAKLSQRCHADATKESGESIRNIERQIDQAAAQLWSITENELRAIQKALEEI
jgi:hypothetical protein